MEAETFLLLVCGILFVLLVCVEVKQYNKNKSITLGHFDPSLNVKNKSITSRQLDFSANEIIPNLWISNQGFVSSQNVRQIIPNLGAIVNVTHDISSQENRLCSNIACLHLPLHGHETTPLRSNFCSDMNEIYQFISTHLGNGSAVLVHCAAGINRSVVVVIFYLMRTYHIPFSQALSLVQHQRPVARPNRTLTDAIQVC